MPRGDERVRRESCGGPCQGSAVVAARWGMVGYGGVWWGMVGYGGVWCGMVGYGVQGSGKSVRLHPRRRYTLSGLLNL